MNTRISRFLVAMVATFAVLLGSLNTALAAPPPTGKDLFLEFKGGVIGDNPTEPNHWRLGGATANSIERASMWYGPRGDWWWYDIYSNDQVSYVKWTTNPNTGAAVGQFRMKFIVIPGALFNDTLTVEGTIKETSRNLTENTISFSIQWSIVQGTSGCSGWTGGGTASGVGTFERTAGQITRIGFPKNGAEVGIEFSGKYNKPGTPPPAPQSVAPITAPMIMSPAPTTAEIIDTGLETLEDAGPTVTDEEIDATLTTMEEAVGIRPRRGGK